MKPDGVNLWYFKLRLFGLTELIFLNVQTLQHLVWKKNRFRKLEFVTMNQFLSDIISPQTVKDKTKQKQGSC